MEKFFIGHQLRALREQRNLLKVELARLAGLGHGFLGELEADKKEPCAGTLRALALALQVSADQLLNLEPRPAILGEHLAMVEGEPNAVRIRDIDTHAEVIFRAPLLPSTTRRAHLDDPVSALTERLKRLNCPLGDHE